VSVAQAISPVSAPVERTVSSKDGVRLAVIEAGDRALPTVVLVHGYPDTKELWQPLLAHLVKRYHVVAYDLRGMGASSAPRGPAAYDFDRLGDDLEAVIAAVAPGRPVHLVGHDWGGIQGWEFATKPRFDGVLRSFTTIAGPSLDQVSVAARELLARPSPAHLVELARRASRSWYVLATCTPGVPTLTWRGPLGRGGWGRVLRHIERVPAERATPSRTLPADATHAANLYRRNIPRKLRRPRRDAVAHVPVQVIVPTADHFISPHYYDLAERYAPALKRRTIGTTHWAPLIQPALLARWVSEFVDEVEAGRPLRASRPWVPGAGIEQLRGRLALVTGAASGIGLATATALADRGARLLLVDRDAGGLERAAASIAQSHTLVCDVSDRQALEELAARVLDQHGVPDVVVNNAGIGLAGSFLDTEPADWQRIVDINLMGVVHGCRLFARAMIDRGQGGQIVNTASAAAFAPAKDLAAYATTKAGVLMLSECLRAELHAHGIGVTAVCPGFIATDITRTTRYVGRGQAEQQRLAERVTRSYQRRNFTPDRVAEEIVEAIAVDRPVAVITPEAKLMRAMSRFAPDLLRRLARLDVLSG
jgi:NAD(P)-dependent dehydrogenase (short-subunit alcohol dehydrogenase family)/pimeloyl-ACP methyl ester carboxylesterase